MREGIQNNRLLNLLKLIGTKFAISLDSIQPLMVGSIGTGRVVILRFFATLLIHHILGLEHIIRAV